MKLNHVSNTIMKSINFLIPKRFEIQPFNKIEVVEQKNKLIWFTKMKTEIQISRLEFQKDKILGSSENGSRYSFLPSNTKNIEKGFVISSNCKTKNELWKALTEGMPRLKWRSFKGIETKTSAATIDDVVEVVNSLNTELRITTEKITDDGKIIVPGLRPPQVGAIYSILSHWAVSNKIATIVLPTGTGKTETILSTIVSSKISRSLIIVPSDGLRDQFFEKCIGWGILRKIKLVNESMLNPIVLKLSSSPKNEALFESMIEGSNIIVATIAILSKIKEKYFNKIKAQCEVVFIDEAHHSAAPTWDYIKTNLSTSRIVQFTATPFRQDNKQVEGKIIFNYSLEEAQRNNYFTKIEFIPVIDYDQNNWDKTISEKAVEVLKQDIANGKNHFLMARVDNIEKATKIYNTYYKQHSEFNPLLITSKSGDIQKKIELLKTGKSKIVVCVNMLGEGIDIPELKIAALHDIRKSLTITIQFIGRFTRSNNNQSSAKIIANIADVEIEKRLKQLYKEDADWGKLIAFTSANEIQKKIKFQQVLSNFTDSKLPLFNIKPKMSAVVYRTKTKVWRPDIISAHFEKKEKLYLFDLNEVDNLAICIFQNENNIDWLDSDVFVESTWELFLFYFDSAQNLLYVNSSLKNVDSYVVEQLVSVDYKFEREHPFKCYGGLGYVVLFTMGLDKNTDSPIKYAMYAGDDVSTGISEMEKNKSSKSNTYGYGFDNGIETTLGASKKGKIWSRLVGNIQEWKDWCDALGTKLLDSKIDVNEIFKGFLQPSRFDLKNFEILSEPISIDWPSTFYQENESVQLLIFNETIKKEIFEINLFIQKRNDGYEVRFELEDEYFLLHLLYTEDGFQFEAVNFKTIAYNRKNKTFDFIDFLKLEDTFKIRLLDGTFVENNYHFKPHHPNTIFPLSLDSLTVKDWTAVNTSSESMGLSIPYVSDSVQMSTYIDKAANSIYQIIINDDNPGEAADIICIGSREDQLVIEAIHCKFMLSGDQPGSRVKDLYELCCQAQKTIKNFSNMSRLFDHIKAREAKVAKAGNTRFLKGDLRKLEILIKSNTFKRPEYRVTLVQPALKKSKANANVLELLGSTQTLLQETINAKLEIICS